MFDYQRVYLYIYHTVFLEFHGFRIPKKLVIPKPQFPHARALCLDMFQGCCIQNTLQLTFCVLRAGEEKEPDAEDPGSSVENSPIYNYR